MLSVVAYNDVGNLPEFKFQRAVSSSSSGGVVEETLCGYVVRNLVGHLGFDYTPTHFYRFVYRGKNGSDGARQHHIIAVDAEREERRLMATEESRQRYSVERS